MSFRMLGLCLLLFHASACASSSSPAPEAPAPASPAEAEPPPAPAPAEPAPAEPAPVDAAPGASRPALTAAECEAKQGTVVGDIGDGAIHRPDYKCPSGAPPLGNIGATAGEAMAVEGSVCCPR